MPPLHDKQQEVYQDKRRFRIVRAGRRWGKTKLGVYECMEVALRGGMAWWVAPSYRLGKPGWRDLQRLARQIPGAYINKGERLVELPSGGSVQVRTAADPDELRGEGLDFVVLDEAAYMEPEAWYEALRATLADKKGRALFISTPAGVVNWLSELIQKIEAEADGYGADRWGLHHYSSYDNPHLDPEELDDLAGELGTMVYAQEILAEIVELAGTLLRAAWFTYYTRRTVTVMGADDQPEDRTIVQLPDGNAFNLADCSLDVFVDPALSEKQSADYTVVLVAARTPEYQVDERLVRRWLVLEVVRARLEAPDVLDTAEAARARWGATAIYFESVAYQASLVQFGKRDGLVVKGLPADKDKVQRAQPLAAALERGDVLFPEDAPWLDDYERELMLFPNGSYDDQVDASAYMVLATPSSRRRKWAAH